MTTHSYSGQRSTTHTDNHTMNTPLILQSVATFNATNNYDLDAVLEFTRLAAKHAHIVQLARKEAADPQLVLPLGGEEN